MRAIDRGDDNPERNKMIKNYVDYLESWSRVNGVAQVLET